MVSNLGAWRRVSAPKSLSPGYHGHVIVLPCYKSPFWWHGGRALATVVRTVSTMPGQAFGRIGGKGPAGPTRAAVLRSSRTASVRRRWTGQNALTKRRSSPSSNRDGQARPFPTSARRPAVAGHTVRDNKPEQISLLFQVNFYSLDRAQTDQYKPTIIRYFPKRLCSRSPP